jgi:prepilin peptidase CpaA
MAVVLAAFAVLLIACAVTDFLWLRIPNVLVAALIVLFAIAAWIAPPASLLMGHIVPALVAFALSAALFFWGKLGGGDVKLLGAAVLWIGMAKMGPFLIALAIYGAIAIIIFGYLNAQAGNLLVQVGAHIGRVIELPASLKTKRSIPYGIVIAAASLSIGPAIG